MHKINSIWFTLFVHLMEHDFHKKKIMRVHTKSYIEITNYGNNLTMRRLPECILVQTSRSTPEAIACQNLVQRFQQKCNSFTEQMRLKFPICRIWLPTFNFLTKMLSITHISLMLGLQVGIYNTYYSIEIANSVYQISNSLSNTPTFKCCYSLRQNAFIVITCIRHSILVLWVYSNNGLAHI